MDSIKLQDNLDVLVKNFSKETFIFDLLDIYGLPKSTITLLKKNPSKLSGKENEVILKNKLFFHITKVEEDEHIVIDNLQKDKNTYKFNPRFIIVTDFKTLLAVDTKTKETLDISIKDLEKHYAFFLPWAGMEKAQHANENPADIRAAYKMDKLYQAIVADNSSYYKLHSHDLNVFLSRLLFCFFAEDTNIFKSNIFTNSIASHTNIDGSDLNNYFVNLFEVLNTKDSDRSKFANNFTEFPYVNGGLFEKNIKLPIFTHNSRRLIIECGKLGWDAINPDIFGSMIQAVIKPDQRENLGMHYTSVSNIMKVIKPLFLEELYEELERIKEYAIELREKQHTKKLAELREKKYRKKLAELRERISKIKIFDPACGSGNFLIISYKELCKLEIEILKHLNLQDSFATLEGWDYSQSVVTLNNFFGIEIDDFAHEIAKLSLYLAQHQINLEFEKEFGKLKPILPLRESGIIKCANATRVDWDKICPRKGLKKENHEIYVIGNPPYYGSKKQTKEQKNDLNQVFEGHKKISNIDYIACWFFLGRKYIKDTQNKLAFVSTNSICQGEQVPILWPLILKNNIEISFCHQSFKWKNSAKGNAGVTCVIIGLRSISKGAKYIYKNETKHEASSISPYLVEAEDNLYVHAINKSLSNLGEIILGSSPIDGGYLVLSKEDKDLFILDDPTSKKFIKPYMGGGDFLNGIERYCLWIDDEKVGEANKIKLIKERIDKCKKFRMNGGRDAKKAVTVSHRFFYRKYKYSKAIILPMTSSERRDYITCDYLDAGIVFSNGVLIIYDPELYIFSILSSKMHMAWTKAVAGRLKTDIRYSGTICFNTFPFPNITPQQKEALTGHVYNILEEREKYPDRTMAELYDPEKMPEGLRDAHEYLDIAIDKIYRNKPFENDEDRLAHLFKLYKKMITQNNLQINI